MTAAAKPLRADAVRNRQAIIAAAATVFADEGTGVTLERIAAAAGVGVGTIYRRFASVDELVAIVLVERIGQYADRTEAAAAQAIEEPWEAFRDWVLFLLEQQATDLAFSDVLLGGGSGAESFQTEQRRAIRASVHLVNRAKAAGAVRSDFHQSDLLMMQYANAGLVRGARRSAPDAWRRFADYLLLGFHSDAGSLAPPPENWLREQERLTSAEQD